MLAAARSGAAILHRDVLVSVFKSDFKPSAQQVAADLDRDGFVCLENVVDSEWLERARAAVKDHLSVYGEKYFSILRPGDEPDSPAQELVGDPQVEALLHGVTQAACPAGMVDEGVYNVLRIIAGPDGGSGSLGFHYDASVVTMLVPLFIPENEPGKSGELVVFPNARPFRRSVAFNLVEKAFTQNRFFRKLTTSRFWRDPDRYTRVLKPGNVYLFWGYRTFHGNLPCAPNSLRATVLLHYGNPHGNNSALKAVRSTRKAIEQRRLSQA